MTAGRAARSQPFLDAADRVKFLREHRYVLLAALHAARAVRNGLHQSLTGRAYTAKHLERQFQRTSDPWDLEGSETGTERFRNTWKLVPSHSYPRILEIGCAEGHFTGQIVTRFPNAEVVALDFIPLAIERARARCGSRSNLEFRCLDLAAGTLSGQFDLIFCMGVLEYGPTLGQLDGIRDRILDLLAPGAYLLLESQRVAPEIEHRWWARRLGYGARALHDRFVTGDVVRVAEAMVCGDWCLATLFRKRA